MDAKRFFRELREIEIDRKTTVSTDWKKFQSGRMHAMIYMAYTNNIITWATYRNLAHREDCIYKLIVNNNYTFTK